MSEVIVRMAMPKGCASCPMVDDDARFCKAAKEYIPMLEKPSWCPIIGELPEHGDLIDRDHFKECLDMVCDAGGWLEPITQAVRVYCKKQADAEKVIVPATESDCHECASSDATTPNTKWESITIKTGNKASDFWT